MTWSMVSVPVLSVHNTSMAPKFWMEFSRLTITFLRLMASAPLERQTETIIGSISGVRPTATAIAKKKASFQSCLVKPLMRKTRGHHHQYEPDHEPGEAVEAPVEAGWRALLRDRAGHAAEIGM